MSGRAPWSTPGTQGETQTVTIQNRPEVKTKKFTVGSNVGAGSATSVDIYAPTNAVWHLQQLRMNAGSIGSATTGSHRFQTWSAGFIRAARASANYSDDLRFKNNHWFASASPQEPGTQEMNRDALLQMICTDSKPITITYINDSDATQSGDVTVNLVVKEVTY